MDLRRSRPRLVGAALLAVIALLYGAGLDFPGVPYYDEVYHVPTARKVLLEGYDTTNSHPLLGHMLMAACIRLFGDTPWSWRLPSLISALIALWAAGLLAWLLTGRMRVAVLTGLVLAVDGVTLTQARIGMLNSPMLAFILLSLCAALSARRAGPGQDLRLVLAGVLLGAAIATRWVALGAWPVLLFVGRSRALVPERPVRAVKVAAYLVCVPILVYALVHLPVVIAQGADSALTFQKNILRYHWTLDKDHTYGSRWWSWPLLLRPIWYFFERDAGLVRGIVCIGNPAVFWLWPAAAAAAGLAWIRKDAATRSVILLTGAGLACLWLPWAALSRVQFFHYYQTALPFTALVWAVALDRWLSAGRAGRALACVILAVFAACFVYGYPLWTAQPVRYEDYRSRMLLKSWV